MIAIATQRHGGGTVLPLDHPPVNAFDLAVLEAIEHALREGTWIDGDQPTTAHALLGR